jgi:hypothetical protein
VTARAPSPSLQALVARLVDYAGLFPPAGRSMPEATREYAEHLASREAWMLGRFVVPVARLDELAAEARRLITGPEAPWRVSALLGDDPRADARAIRAFNVAHDGALRVDAAEVKVDSPERIGQVARELDRELDTYVELPLEPDPRPLLEVVRGAGLGAKMRTGGVTPEAFPAPALVARFLARCAELGVRFKATAGLHHPLRGVQRLTYEADSRQATMFGFINVFVAAALAAAGAEEEELAAVLEERRIDAFVFSEHGVRWRGHVVSLEQLAHARRGLAVSFGSCSFRDPVNDLKELALL